ncbi:cytochrome d ubiquinol oxidase subunit II [Desulfococcaceae bacterium HSG9]|nr:cytochrome d ubiquinol oxidase subunit II [Desulfococcaceae bacterium HSG9]
MALQITWFYLWGLLWAIFFITDGFDFGVGALLPFLGKNDDEKRMMINSIGPLWDGNEVWLITAGGVTFAAFPLVYATMFSTLYTPLMLILFALILRGVSFEFRGKVESPAWRFIWDTCTFIGSVAPAILFGVAFANIFKGIPFDGQGVYHGTLLTLLNPYGLLGGVLFLVLFLQHGTLWTAIKTEGDLHERAALTATFLWPIVLVVAVIFLIYSAFATSLYANYIANPIWFLVILITVAALLGVRYFVGKKEWFKAWFASALTIAGAVFFGIIGLFPNLYPSSIKAEFNLTAFNASSSPLTLQIMLIVVIIFIPIVLCYQIWAYNLFKGKVTQEDLEYEEAY